MSQSIFAEAEWVISQRDRNIFRYRESWMLMGIVTSCLVFIGVSYNPPASQASRLGTSLLLWFQMFWLRRQHVLSRQLQSVTPFLLLQRQTLRLYNLITRTCLEGILDCPVVIMKTSTWYSGQILSESEALCYFYSYTLMLSFIAAARQVEPLGH